MKNYCIRPSIFNSSVRMKNKFYYSWPWNTSTATVLIIILKVTIIYTLQNLVIWYFCNSMDWEKLNSGYLWGWRIKKRISLSINCFHKLRKSLIIDFCQSKYWNTNFVLVTLPFNQYLHICIWVSCFVCLSFQSIFSRLYSLLLWHANFTSLLCWSRRRSGINSSAIHSRIQRV